MFSRKLKGIGEITRYTGYNCGAVLEWQYFIDWPGEPGWIVSKRALRTWMRKHNIVMNPEQKNVLNLLKKQIKLPRRRW